MKKLLRTIANVIAAAMLILILATLADIQVHNDDYLEGKETMYTLPTTTAMRDYMISLQK